MRQRPRRRGFTLVELLVVIAIIALLVSILLPALKRARNVAKLAQSLSNIKNISLANQAYRNENKGTAPYMVPPTKVPATWSFAGKNCNPFWISFSGAIYDFPGKSRPLNTYLMPEIRFEETFTVENRDAVQMPVMMSPGDKSTVQRTYPSPTPDFSISCYNDVGTSYQYNGRWYNGVAQASSDQWSAYSVKLSQAFGRAVDSAEVNTSLFVMFHDQAADLVSNDARRRNWITEFGDQNKCVMTFLDGHADYVYVDPGAGDVPSRYIFNFPRMSQIVQAIRP